MGPGEEEPPINHRAAAGKAAAARSGGHGRKGGGFTRLVKGRRATRQNRPCRTSLDHQRREPLWWSQI